MEEEESNSKAFSEVKARVGTSLQPLTPEEAIPCSRQPRVVFWAREGSEAVRAGGRTGW